MSLIKISGSKGEYSFDPDFSFLRAGKFSAVFIGKDECNRNVLVKQLTTVSDSHERNLQFDHPTFVGILDECKLNSSHYLIRSYIEGDSLFNLSKSAVFKKKSNRDLVVHVIREVGEALFALHSAGMMHGDIRPHNVLLEFVGKVPKVDSPVRIIDLAMMREVGSVPTHRGYALLYSPPELILKKYTLSGAASDQYSMAIMMYELLSGTIPFKHVNPELLTHLMLVHPLKEVDGINGATLKILQKASSRFSFKRPPVNLDHEELSTQLKQAIDMRYENVKVFAEELASSLLNERKSVFSFFRS